MAAAVTKDLIVQQATLALRPLSGFVPAASAIGGTALFLAQGTVGAYPYAAAAAGAALLVVAAPGLVTTPALAVAGFTPAGVQAGSVAAAVQGTIGNVGAGTFFAMGQSAGAGGAALAMVNGAVQASGAVAAAGIGAAKWFKQGPS